ncbi:MAG: aminotransferase class V-fold PLP-dependent enzyme, partial [Frankia sp.]|nr:aminotransferase class V-fold PLP-dependent enzyme [Frankia sp.]
MTKDARRYGMGTRAVHPPAPPVPAQRPMGLPTYRTAAFIFDSAEDYSDILNDRKPGYTYSRIDNPTADAFALGVAELEGAEAAQPFASGMAAISTVLLAFLSTGDHLVGQSQLYGGTFSMIRHVLPRFGIDSTLVDGADLDAVASSIGPKTRLVWVETLANPAMTVADLPALAELAHAHDALLVVDSTFASPVVCRPLEWGADIVVHSATKYLGGHGDVTGGVALGSAELMKQVRALRIDLGGSLAPDDAFLLQRGISTMPLRVERHCANALAFAEAMSRHARVERVDYP